VAEALDECDVEIASLKYTAAAYSDQLGKKCRVPRGSYEKSVEKVCKKYDLEMSELSMETALSRTKVGRKLKVKHRGKESPMIGIEAHLLAAIPRRAALRQSVTCGEGLVLVKSMIEGTEAQVRLNWKKNNLKNGPNDDAFGTLGQRYSQNVCRRNADVITSKKAVRFDSKRDDWCRLEHFPICMMEYIKYDRQTSYSLLHQDKLVFFDEVG
jgi:hypothetical protein